MEESPLCLGGKRWMYGMLLSGAYLRISSIYLVDRPEKRTFVLHERSGRYRESIARGGELERVALLSEVGGIVPDDLRLLRPFPAQARRPHGGPDGAGGSLGKAEQQLLNVTRSSIHELREDFKDYLLSRKLSLWDKHHPRYAKMHDFTKAHNRLKDYEPYFARWTSEEMANIGYTMCCQIDVMMNGYLATLDDRFRKEGGIKERMYRVRTGYRAEQDRKMREMEATIQRQAERIKELEAELARKKEEERKE